MSERDRLTGRWGTEVLVADGAMGTLLIARGAQVASCVEVLNLDAPQMVVQAHRDYVAAGARIVETNTFASNRLKLAAHELRGKLAEINRAGVALARQAAGDAAYVAASVGPLGALMWPFGIVKADEARDVFAEHIAAVAAGEPDVLLLETFGGVAELLLALEAAKRVAPGVPVLASLSVVEDGTTQSGDSLPLAFSRLLDAGADALGVNCAVGPQAVYDALAPLGPAIQAPLSVMPNAGYPQRLDDRTVYESSPAYFARFAKRFVELGATIVGGCCGTTPEHISAIAAAVSGERRHRHSAAHAIMTDVPQPDRSPDKAPAAVASATAFERRLGRRFVMTVEMSPPRGADPGDAVAAARALEAAGADAVNISDNPTARLRMSSTALAALVMRATKLATILHLTCRDRNLLALQSELLGAAALGITGVLALTGDPSTMGDFPKATSVFDVTALGLTQIVRDLNAGKDQAGNRIGRPTHLRIGVAVNPASATPVVEFEKLDQKVRAGADFAVTQPVFEVASIGPFLERAATLRLPVLVGVLVLHGSRNADFLHNEVPGMRVPDAVRGRLAQAGDEAAEGIAIASELLVELARTPGVGGAYIIPQERYDAAAAAMAAASRTLSLA